MASVWEMIIAIIVFTVTHIMVPEIVDGAMLLPQHSLLRTQKLPVNSNNSISAKFKFEMPSGCQVDLSAGATRDMFPPEFYFGSATAAYQVEGVGEGRGRNIWDVWCDTPGKILDGSNADVADDQYTHYQDDVALMKSLGMTTYRLSIAWSRILPEGVGDINWAGVAYYNRLIDALLAAGIQPAVTLYHWDLPEALYRKDNAYGWLRASIKDEYVAYADLCFSLFGDRVRTWLTFNEPHDFCYGGYAAGYSAPGRCTSRAMCASGDSSREAYMAAHNVLRSHAAAVALYRAKYQKVQGGRIGITLNCIYHYPGSSASADVAAANRLMEFMLGWFFDPIFSGDYPLSMRQQVGSRLPRFSAKESAMLKGSFDFLGLNFYTAKFAFAGSPPSATLSDPTTDAWAQTSIVNSKGEMVGEPTVSTWLFVVPQAAKEMLMWLTKRYPGVPIIVTENGVSEPNDSSLPLEEALCDPRRVKYYQDYLFYMAEAIKAGAKLEGYYAWSLMDNFEWAQGYTQRFGVVHVNFTDPARPRSLKASAIWWSSFLGGSLSGH